MGAPAHRDGSYINRCILAGRHNEAETLIREWLHDDPSHPHAHYLAAFLCIETDKPELAIGSVEQLIRTAPDWYNTNLVAALLALHLRMPDKAREHAERTVAAKETNESCAVMAQACLKQRKLDEAEHWGLRALEYAPDDQVASTALAFVYFLRREWNKGWQYFRAQMGHCSDRIKCDYGLPEWQGEGSVLVYSEQGLGDQLCYASALDARCVQLDCHPKLANLLARSLDCEVHGDQGRTAEWQPTAQFQASMTEAMCYQDVRPRGRWLKPHPDKKIQWQGLLASKGIRSRPWIGLAWTGGRKQWERVDRSVTARDLAPILALDFNFVSLEYREHENIPGVYQWPWATQTNDLDDFAALVDCLAAVVTVPTTTYHLAGGLGIPAHVIVHDNAHFHEGTEGPCPWWESVKFHRGGRASAIADIVQELNRL